MFFISDDNFAATRITRPIFGFLAVTGKLKAADWGTFSSFIYSYFIRFYFRMGREIALVCEQKMEK